MQVSRSPREIVVTAVLDAMTMTATSTLHAASTCRLDTGGPDAVNDGVVLTRYALGTVR